jgi:hypothetical protein
MASETPRYKLSAPAKAWASKSHQKVSPTRLKERLSEQREKCALSGTPLLFDKALGTLQKGGQGVHPLYPAVDHRECGNPRTSGVAALSPQGESWSTISSARRDQRQRGSGAPPIQPLLFRLGEE